jgi:hypothetical protein
MSFKKSKGNWLKGKFGNPTLSFDLILCLSSTVVSLDGKEFKLTPDLLTIERKTFKQSSGYRPHNLRCMHALTLYLVREYTPNVIEPSFGLGRILYTLLEHSYWSREQDIERGVRTLLIALIESFRLIIIRDRRFFPFHPLWLLRKC